MVGGLESVLSLNVKFWRLPTGTAEDSSGKRSGRKGESWRESPHLPRESIDNHEQDVSRNTNVKAHSFKVLGKKKEHVFEEW